MSNFLFDLATNLAILATLLIACHLCNLAKRDLALNGGYVYLVLATTALVFDATLTFCVFADAPSRYGKFSSPNAFVERACAYTLTCALALYCARRVRLHRNKAKAGDALVIRTSPYTESQLPM
jgi:O-antigen ligase